MTPKLKGTCPPFTKCALNTLTFHLNPYRPTFLFKKAPTKPKLNELKAELAKLQSALAKIKEDKRGCVVACTSNPQISCNKTQFILENPQYQLPYINESLKEPQRLDLPGRVPGVDPNSQLRCVLGSDIGSVLPANPRSCANMRNFTDDHDFCDLSSAKDHTPCVNPKP